MITSNIIVGFIKLVFMISGNLLLFTTAMKLIKEKRIILPLEILEDFGVLFINTLILLVILFTLSILILA